MNPTAEYLLKLRLDGKTVAQLPEHLVPLDLAAGYKIQDELVQGLCTAHDSKRIGYKVALTSSMAQTLVGYPAPVFGQILAHSSVRGGSVLPADRFTTRIVETEFSFRFARDVPQGVYTRESILPFVGVLIPSIELVDHRFAALDRMNAPVLAADNAIHGGWVEGPSQADWQHVDLGAHAVSLRVNGAEILSGAGDRVLGNPLEVLAWLANELPKHGLSLCAGDYVTTGLATDGIYDAVAGDELVADFGSLGQVVLIFA